MKKSLIGVACALMLANCAPAAAPPDPAVAIQAIHTIEINRIAALRARDLDAALAPYAPDAMFVVSGRPTASTPEQLRATLQAMIDDQNTSITLTPGRAEVSASGDLAFTNAMFESTYTNEQGHAATASGSNVTVWRKQPDGSWRIVADFNISATPDDRANTSSQR